MFKYALKLRNGVREDVLEVLVSTVNWSSVDYEYLAKKWPDAAVRLTICLARPRSRN